MDKKNKKIVLFSDGTGNSAGSQNRTNVWRMYDMLDVHCDDQIAFYDNGVGSQEFIVLKALGGAFGYGLKNNVCDLYKMLCRSYQKGDKIYLFGFSRGAFTVRVLAGMIAHCGLWIGENDEAELDKITKKNYSALRALFPQTLLSSAYRKLFSQSDTPKFNVKPDIQFVGVWDTVDAYGLPIEELSVLWDRHIFPIRFPDRELSPKVKAACHAMSVDDERLTFHPLLWNEENETDPERIEQVWFPGVHADVGGGYPQDNLSRVALDWMISRIEDRGEDSLVFIEEKRKEVTHHADWHGVLHDSRAGVGAYYRYKPRYIDYLSHCREAKVEIDTPKIHRSVLERIQQDVVFYVPTGLPAKYKIVSTRGEVAEYETEQEKQDRAEAMSPALDVIFIRRWLYAALLLVTLLFIGSRFFLEWKADGSCVSWGCAIDPALIFIKDLLPDLLGGWFDAWRQHPNWLFGIAAGFLVFSWLKKKAWNRTQLYAVRAWAVLKGKVAASNEKSTGRIRRFREKAHSSFRTNAKWAMASMVMVIMLTLMLAVVSRVTFHVRDSLGNICKATEASSFEASNPCYASGVTLEVGKTYRISAIAEDLKDGSITTDLDGYSKVGLMPFVPFRRHINERWFKLMGRIGSEGNEVFAIGKSVKYTAKTDGELFLYVNDAVFGLFPTSWAWPYTWSAGENTGLIEVTVRDIVAE